MAQYQGREVEQHSLPYNVRGGDFTSSQRADKEKFRGAAYSDNFMV